MNNFHHIIGKKITAIQRIDSDPDYDSYSPCAIVFTLEEQSNKLIISTTNDDSSIEVKVTSDDSIIEDYGLEFSECLLSPIKKGDELWLFIDNSLQSIEVARYNQTYTEGQNFILLIGTYAAVEIKTENHKLLFQSMDSCGWCEIDDYTTELENKHSYKWEGKE